MTAAAFGGYGGYKSKLKRFRAHVLWRKMFSVPSNVLFNKKIFDLRGRGLCTLPILVWSDRCLLDTFAARKRETRRLQRRRSRLKIEETLRTKLAHYWTQLEIMSGTKLFVAQNKSRFYAVFLNSS